MQTRDDFAYDRQYGYHPLLISLANTAEPLFLFNRSGNRPSQELADVYLDKAATFCRQAGFRKILMRGDTKFAQTNILNGGTMRATSVSSSGTSHTSPSKREPMNSRPMHTAF